jgi:hypothetical protein
MIGIDQAFQPGASSTAKCLKLKKIYFLDAIGSLSVTATIYQTQEIS